MGEADDALFDKKVRSTIRKCAVVTAPIWLPIMGAFGWWFSGLDGAVKDNTKTLTRVETKLEYIADSIKVK